MHCVYKNCDRKASNLPFTQINILRIAWKVQLFSNIVVSLLVAVVLTGESYDVSVVN